MRFTRADERMFAIAAPIPPRSIPALSLGTPLEKSLDEVVAHHDKDHVKGSDAGVSCGTRMGPSVRLAGQGCRVKRAQTARGEGAAST